MVQLTHLVFALCLLAGCGYAASFPLGGERCLQPKQSGLCLAYFPSFFFNASMGRCESFIYGGCQGNQNRFLTEHSCLEACAGTTAHGPENDVSSSGHPHQPNEAEAIAASAAGSAPSKNDVAAQAAADSNNEDSAVSNAEASAGSNIEEPAISNAEASAGSNNEKHAESNNEPADSSVQLPVDNACSLPKESGLCYGYFTRYHFDGVKCDEFIYGGCGGNKNNFGSLEDCNEACPQKAR